MPQCFNRYRYSSDMVERRSAHRSPSVSGAWISRAPSSPALARCSRLSPRVALFGAVLVLFIIRSMQYGVDIHHGLVSKREGPQDGVAAIIYDENDRQCLNSLHRVPDVPRSVVCAILCPVEEMLAPCSCSIQQVPMSRSLCQCAHRVLMDTRSSPCANTDTLPLRAIDPVFASVR